MESNTPPPGTPPAPIETPADPPAPAPAAPTAGTTVAGGKSEREIELERLVEQEQNARRKAETIAAEKEDEAKRLRDLQSGAPKKKKKKTSGGFTFFDPVVETEEEV
jgi:hypothetical protein